MTKDSEGKIIKCTDQELYEIWIKKYAGKIGYPAYLAKCKEEGIEVFDRCLDE